MCGDASNMEVKDVEKSCCVVTLTEALSTKAPVSFSGVLVRPGAVICTGFPFFRFVTHKKPSARRLLRHNFQDALQISVTFPSGRDVEANPCGLTHECPTTTTTTRQWEAELLMLVNCVEFKQAFQAVFQEADGWRFHGDEDEELIGDADHLSWFAVLKTMEHLKPGASWEKSSALRKGVPVLACGSPFGSLCVDLFISTISGGIISNLAGEDNAVILTDARCVPGTEGGGLFALKDSGGVRLIGVIVSPFGWKANEWIGLTLVCSVQSIFRNVLRCANAEDPLRDVCLHPAEVIPDPDSMAGPYPVVGLVDSGQQWGSGVLVTSDLVLTCRHVVKGKSTVAMKFHHRDRVLDRVGDVIFSTKTSSPYDVAVVQLTQPFPDFRVPRTSQKFHPGERLLVVGYGGLGGRCGPSLTCGVLSKAISVNRRPVMLQTTCAVQAGASGGAVVRASSGELLGMVASNTRDVTAKVTYPHLNFCIPVTVLQGPLRRFHQQRDVTAFEALDTTEEEVRRVWRLQDAHSKL
ncbi:peroxisomal leader peptide-processing protease [Entelurus aequoreus]|uniref:peroxisomal leader peptide-processing protease n=1 Tax=Entelurus aequoreus TaxID=161455 RepID=UPI002B1E464E|nr:peroxisomal leader peptide-processing protease [Entelurus aequoreus]XP_061914015.1 peroxisomal leader peptide-processing protease [Entelurus aequoreus]